MYSFVSVLWNIIPLAVLFVGIYFGNKLLEDVLPNKYLRVGIVSCVVWIISLVVEFVILWIYYAISFDISLSFSFSIVYVPVIGQLMSVFYGIRNIFNLIAYTFEGYYSFGSIITIGISDLLYLIRSVVGIGLPVLLILKKDTPKKAKPSIYELYGMSAPNTNTVTFASDSVKPVVNTFCPNCGAKLEAGANFCPNCGSKL